MPTSPVRFARTLFGSAGLAAAVSLYAVAGCSGGGAPGDDGASSSSSSSSGGETPRPSGSNDPGAIPGTSSNPDENAPGSPSAPSSNAPTCQEETDCPTWFCECEEGPPVNTRHCTNDRCEDAAVACPKSCKSFGTCWTGQAGGGWDGGTNSGPNDCKPPTPPAPPSGNGCGDQTSFTDLGKGCTQNAQCQSGQCWGVNPSFVCTKRCKNANQCPKNWECVSNGSFDICLQGDKANTTPSTNASCAQVSFTDLGDACTLPTHCQTLICLGQQYCSKRCYDATDCPSGWSCTKGTGFDYCTK